MPSDRYYGDDITEFQIEINGSTITAGAVTDVSIRGEAEHDELFDPEDVSFSEVKRREVAVIVEFTIREFDEELVQYWLGGGNSASSSVAQTSDVARYDIIFEQRATDHSGTTGDVSLRASVEGFHVSDMPLLEMTQGEYNEHDVSGRANNVTLTKETVP